MKKIVKADLPVEKRFITVEEGREIFKGQTYKLELLEEYAESWQLSVYRQGDFTDLCAGPHLMSTGAVKAVKLLSTASAYWRGDAARDSLCRVYGTAYPKAAELEAYLNMLEEAKKRDHRKLGKELGLFALLEEGPGFPFFLPKGMLLKTPSSTTGAKSISARAIRRSARPSSSAGRCGSAAATGTITRIICTPRSSTARTFPLSP